MARVEVFASDEVATVLVLNRKVIRDGGGQAESDRVNSQPKPPSALQDTQSSERVAIELGERHQLETTYLYF